MSAFPFKKIETKWKKQWEKERLYKAGPASDSRKKNLYILDMFPYASGDGLHVGHAEGYTASDILARYYRMRGFRVLHPMGWDAFGLPAENYAIKKKTMPQEVVKKNVARFKSQIRDLGFSYDWSREINTTDPEYYRWTQWIFLKFFEKGLAYRKATPVNWCSLCKTILADEEAEGGTCERCGARVEKKNLEQWMLKITAYADRLIKDLEGLDWPEKVKTMQRNWIGRSEGAMIKFPISNFQFSIEVFTTRPDTLFGATYLVLAPEHEFVSQLLKTKNSQGKVRERKSDIKNLAEVSKYVKMAINKSEQDRISEGKEKTGVELKGISAVNPANGLKIPVYIADYVLAHYGSGAIMAVPAHDERDFAFARQYNLPVVEVISPRVDSGEKGGAIRPKPQIGAYIGNGILVNSGKFNGVESERAKEEITEFVKGTPRINYKLRDWIFTRQRYWGEPIPLVFCSSCKKQMEIFKAQFPISKLKKMYSEGELRNPGWAAVSEKELPVTLPKVKNYKPTGALSSPLAAINSWVKTKCPRCGGPAHRETNTMPQWAGSCWYYLRYLDPKNKKEIASKKAQKEFLPVSIYIGGVEHAVLHLLYARFWHKFLYDIGAVTTEEPFKRLINQGIILGSDGEKMSKSRGNVVSPDDIVKNFGADVLRMYEMFMGPLEEAKPWSNQGIAGISRFLQRVWKIYNQRKIESGKTIRRKLREGSGRDKNEKARTREDMKKFEGKFHIAVKKVTEDIEKLRFNTAISALMVLSREFEEKQDIPLGYYEDFAKLLAPFAPFISEELWRGHLGRKKSISYSDWPLWSKRMIVQKTAVIAVQINGKTRGTIETEVGAERNATFLSVSKDERFQKYFSAGPPRKIIFVPGRIINVIF